MEIYSKVCKTKPAKYHIHINEGMKGIYGTWNEVNYFKKLIWLENKNEYPIFIWHTTPTQLRHHSFKHPATVTWEKWHPPTLLLYAYNKQYNTDAWTVAFPTTMQNMNNNHSESKFYWILRAIINCYKIEFSSHFESRADMLIRNRHQIWF